MATHPTIQALIDAGHAFIEPVTGELVGRATDDTLTAPGHVETTEVMLGMASDPGTVAYLAEYPTPDTW